MESGIFLPAQALRKSSKLLRFVLLFLMVFPITGNALSNCVLFSYFQEETYFKDGDFLLGAVIQLNFLKKTFIPDFSESPNQRYDLEVELQNYRHYLAFIYGIEEINTNNNILPNISLGYNIYESLGLEGFAQNAVLKILTGTNDLVPNYSCSKTGVIAAFIGDQSSLTSLSMARVIDLYSYTQISYGAMDPIFDDRLQFPFFYRTVPRQYFQHDAIIRILQHFDWTWVGIISSDDDNSQRGSQELKEQIINSGRCVDYLETIGNYITDTIDTIVKVSDVIKDSTANVIILYSLAQNFNNFLIQNSIGEHLAVVWIISCTWSYPTELENLPPLLIFNGSLVLSIGKGNIPGLKEFMYSASPQKYPEDYRLKWTWCTTFLCDPPNDPNDTDPYHLGYGLPPCNGSETLQDLPLREYDVQNFKITYSIYTAVYALAHALHAMLSDQSVRVKDKLGGNREYEQWKLRHYLKNIHFSTSSGEILFDVNGGRPGYYDIVNWNFFQNLSESQEIIGNFKTSVLEEEQFYINASAFRWNHMYTKFPRSTCSDSCEPGYRKSPRESKPSCCYDCVQCPEGEISNTTDMESCIPCPEDQWSNFRRDTCIPRIVEFLSYGESLGVTLLITAVLLSVITAAVLGLFLLYRDTPVVRANNRDLSYLLLLSLMFSFLCTLLFIGRPGQITCQLRQSVFGFFFVVAVSSVLAKTITVVIAFKATKPGSKFRKWLGNRVSKYLLIVCSSIQVTVCITWLVHSPPYPEYDTQSITGMMILQCNEGSAMAFYIVIGYMGCLAVMSFLVAFLARKIPDDYNETQLITFSMLVFCSVWISFIPAYVSSHGKYTVAVEVFAILASSGGLLGCIVFPKCYIILLRPDLNTRGHLTSKHSH